MSKKLEDNLSVAISQISVLRAILQEIHFTKYFEAHLKRKEKEEIVSTFRVHITEILYY